MGSWLENYGLSIVVGICVCLLIAATKKFRQYSKLLNSMRNVYTGTDITPYITKQQQADVDEMLFHRTAPIYETIWLITALLSFVYLFFMLILVDRLPPWNTITTTGSLLIAGVITRYYFLDYQHVSNICNVIIDGYRQALTQQINKAHEMIDNLRKMYNEADEQLQKEIDAVLIISGLATDEMERGLEHLNQLRDNMIDNEQR